MIKISGRESFGREGDWREKEGGGKNRKGK